MAQVLRVCVCVCSHVCVGGYICVHSLNLRCLTFNPSPNCSIFFSWPLTSSRHHSMFMIVKALVLTSLALSASWAQLLTGHLPLPLLFVLPMFRVHSIQSLWKGAPMNKVSVSHTGTFHCHYNKQQTSSPLLLKKAGYKEERQFLSS